MDVAVGELGVGGERVLERDVEEDAPALAAVGGSAVQDPRVEEHRIALAQRTLSEDAALLSPLASQ